MDYLEPICPAIVHAQSTVDFTIINSVDADTTDILDTFSKYKSQSIGIIGMEYLMDYKRLDSLIRYPNIQSYIHMAAFIILRLAMETGYTQGDFHSGNIMIDPNETTYFKGIKGKPILLDYGDAIKIPLTKLTTIKQHYKNKQYTDALKVICTVEGDEIDLRSIPESYGYLCGIYNLITDKPIRDFPVGYNNCIDKLVVSYEKAIDDRLKLPNLPNIPLSNSSKNAMFSGLNIEVNKYKPVSLVFTNQNKITIKLYERLITWMYLIYKHYKQPINTYILTCYHIVYIINHQDNIVVNDLQLIGIVGGYYASLINKDLNNLITLYSQLLQKGKRYSVERIQTEFDKWSELSTVEFVLVTNYMDINKLKKMSQDDIIKFMMDPKVYTDPHTFAQPSLPASTLASLPDYTFSEYPKLNGGKKYRKTKRGKRKSKVNNKYNKKLMKKTKKRIKHTVKNNKK
jgi:hypothetical protein